MSLCQIQADVSIENLIGELSPSEQASLCEFLGQLQMLQKEPESFENCAPAVHSPSSTACSVDMTSQRPSLTARRRRARRQNRVANCGGTTDTNARDSASAFSGEVVTMMIRNIPRKYTQRTLLAEINSRGFDVATFDFFYLPTDISSGRNLSYAFINFTSAEYAQQFKQVFHKLHLVPDNGSPTSVGPSTSGLSISAAVVQGLQRNLDNLTRNASVHRIKNPEYLPMVLDKSCMQMVPYMPPKLTKERKEINKKTKPQTGNPAIPSEPMIQATQSYFASAWYDNDMGSLSGCGDGQEFMNCLSSEKGVCDCLAAFDNSVVCHCATLAEWY